jgi:hypothetical protein
MVEISRSSIADLKAGLKARGMKDPGQQFEELLIQAQHCDLIAKLAVDRKKRELFTKLATDLLAMAHEVRARITEQANNGLSDEATQNPARSEVGRPDVKPLNDE